MRLGLIVTLTLITTAGCTKKPPEPTPTPIDMAMQRAAEADAQAQAQGRQMSSYTLRFVEPTEDEMVGLIVAAGGWARRSVARTLGVLQRPDETPVWRRAAEQASLKYGLRPIGLDDYTVVCGGNQPQQGSISRGTPTCSMKYVDAVLQFNSVRMRGDSGYVTVGVTRVPPGANRPQTTYTCVTLGRKSGAWEARRSEPVVDIHRCPRP